MGQRKIIDLFTCKLTFYNELHHKIHLLEKVTWVFTTAKYLFLFWFLWKEKEMYCTSLALYQYEVRWKFLSGRKTHLWRLESILRDSTSTGACWAVRPSLSSCLHSSCCLQAAFWGWAPGMASLQEMASLSLSLFATQQRLFNLQRSYLFPDL